MTATPTPLRELLRQLAKFAQGSPCLCDGVVCARCRAIADAEALSARDEAGADWLDAMRDQRAHLRLALVMMRDFASNLRGLDHDADVTDWPSVIGRFERAFDDMFDWAERRLAAVAPEGMVLTGHVSGYLPRQQAIEIKADAPLPAWLTSQQFLRVTLAAAPSPASRARPEAQGEAYPTGSDREVLLYLMQQFDAESWECPRCGHSQDCATMDSADYLRRYLATPPADRAPGEVEVEKSATAYADVSVDGRGRKSWDFDDHGLHNFADAIRRLAARTGKGEAELGLSVVHPTPEAKEGK